MDFSALQNEHIRLLEDLKPRTTKEEKKELVPAVQVYILQARQAAENISSTMERNQVRANLRFWGAFVYEQIGEYPNTTLNAPLFPEEQTAQTFPPIGPEAQVPSPKPKPRTWLWAGVGLIGLLAVLAVMYSLIFDPQAQSSANAQKTQAAQLQLTVSAYVKLTEQALVAETSQATHTVSDAGGEQAAATQLAQTAVAQGDDDGDGLSNAQEAMLGTHPGLPDTDGDGLSDGVEIHEIRTDPLNQDTDGDTLPDGKEVEVGTSPLNVDSDADGIQDNLDANPGQLPTPTAQRTSTPIPTPVPAAVCAGTYFSQLKVGGIAYVVSEELSNRLRTDPGLDAGILGKISPGEKVSILAGPACKDEMVWWKVRSVVDPTLEGWTSEGVKDVYWLLPVLGMIPTPTAYQTPEPRTATVAAMFTPIGMFFTPVPIFTPAPPDAAPEYFSAVFSPVKLPDPCSARTVTIAWADPPGGVEPGYAVLSLVPVGGEGKPLFAEIKPGGEALALTLPVDPQQESVYLLRASGLYLFESALIRFPADCSLNNLEVIYYAARTPQLKQFQPEEVLRLDWWLLTWGPWPDGWVVRLAVQAQGGNGEYIYSLQEPGRLAQLLTSNQATVTGAACSTLRFTVGVTSAGSYFKEEVLLKPALPECLIGD